MKNFFFLLLFTVLMISATNAQTTRQERVPGTAPMVMGPGDFENLGVPASMFRYGDISESEKKMQVDIYLSLISQKNKTVEFIIVLSDSAKDLSSSVDWYTNYFKTKKIASERFSFAFGPTLNGRTELWLVPNNKIELPTDPSKPPFKIIGADDEKELKSFLKKD